MLIKNARILTKDNDYLIQDVYVENSMIKEISANIVVKNNNVKVIDLKGKKFLLSGIIDPHVHMRDPGLTHKETIKTGSMACAKGGITTFIDMPNTIPTTTTLSALEHKKKIASTNSLVNYGFHFGGTNDDNSLELPTKGIASTKVFLNESTGNMLVENDATLKNIFNKSHMVCVHSEGLSVDKAISISKETNTSLYLCHISTKSEIESIKEKKGSNKIFTEVTPHHLFLDTSNLDHNEQSKLLLKMKPELKTKEDVAYLWKSIADGTIDTIGTDHAPHLLDEKLNNITYGVPGVETSLPLMLNAVNQGRLTLSRLSNLMSLNPATIFNIKKRGSIKVGNYADLIIIDLEKNQVIKNDNIISKCKWTPFNNFKITGSVDTTIVNGNIVYDDGVFYNFVGMEVVYD